jgi:hypothetical protein
MAGEMALRCARARQWASLHEDGELSELENLKLSRHLAECEDCRRWSRDVAMATLLVRDASLEMPSRRFERPSGLRAARWRKRRVAAATSVAAATAAAASLVAMLPGSSPEPQPTPSLQLSLLPAKARQLEGDRRLPPPAPPPREPGLPLESAI